MTPKFTEVLNLQIERKQSACVVGLDPDMDLLPQWVKEEHAGHATEAILAYNKLVIDAVFDIVPAVKPQSAYYELYGVKGLGALIATIDYAKAKGLLVILDVKRGDIGSTSKAYAKAYLDGQDSGINADALTLNPYLGKDSMEPFCELAVKNGKGLFICAKTSNPGSATLQDLIANGKPVYQHVAQMVAELQDAYGDPFGTVAGATYPNEAQALRNLLPQSIFLVPGMGAQGGDMETLTHFFNADGLGAVVSSSRAIMYPSNASSEASSRVMVRQATEQFVAQVNSARQSSR